MSSRGFQQGAANLEDSNIYVTNNIVADTIRENTLDADLASQFGLFDLFRQADLTARARRAENPLDFQDFDSALTVFNYRGERKIRTVIIQDWYFIQRRQTCTARTSAALVDHIRTCCTRCCIAIPRHDFFFIDYSKKRTHADELCRKCLTSLMRNLLGEDDVQVMTEAQDLRASGWSPTIDIALADALLQRRTMFS